MIEANMRMALRQRPELLSVSDGIEALLGYSPAELLAGRARLEERIHPHDRDIAETLFARSPEPPAGSFNIRLRQANGRIRCVRGEYKKSVAAHGGDVLLDLLLQDAKGLQRTMGDASAMMNFRAMMDNTDDYIYFKDRNHVFTGASQSLVSLCDPAEHWSDLLGQTDYDVFPEEYADIYYRLEKQVFAGVPVANEIQATLTKDGKRGWVDNRKYPIRDERGEIIGLYGIARDITVLKLQDQALQEKNALLQLIYDTASVAIFLVDARGVITHANERMATMFACPMDRMIGSEYVSHTHPSEREQGRTRMLALMAGETSHVDHERRYRREDGSEFWGRLTGQRMFDAEGRMIGLLGVIADVTARRAAEEALKKSEARYRRFAEELTLGIVITQDGLIKYVNRASAELSGYAEDELLGKPFVTLVCEEDRGWLMDLHRRRMQGEKVEPTYVIGIVRKDGEARRWQFHTNTIEWEGKPSGYGIITDVTEKIEAESARAMLEAQLRESQKMEALGTLAGGVAHDFNNALAAIIGNVNLAREDVEPDHPAQISLEEIAKASRRAKDLVQQILAFGRKQNLERKPMSLAMVVVETARFVRASLPTWVKMNVECKADTPTVMADPTQMKQILINLCTNASYAVQAQEQAGVIDINLGSAELATGGEHGNLQPGRYACLTVSDNGIGMDEPTRVRIFEPFFTTKPVGKGTGLGLAVVHGILQAHGASIEVESTPGKGSTFRIYFPAIDVPAEDAAFAPAAAPKTTDAAGQRILYIDDEEAIIFLMTRLLRRKGYRVSGYTNPREALAAIRAAPGDFDLVVTDYSMPEMSGLDVARALKAIRADLPVVLASGYITEELRRQAPAAGISELIYKPNTVDDLCEAVARVAARQ